MRINKLILNNFRNHIDSEIEFSPAINVIWGNNGAGKTSILEAISVCSISKSFVPHSDISLVNKDAKSYTVTAHCINELQVPYKINISFSHRSPKQISSNFGNKLLPKDIIGVMPLVVLSPDNKSITNNSPEFRRHFVNGILAQANKYYLEKLFEIRKILKQRNTLLQQLKQVQTFAEKQNYLQLLEHWTDFFINTSAEIIIRRNNFIREFNPLFVDAYQTVSNSKEDVKIIYLPDSISDINKIEIIDKEQIKSELHLRAKQVQDSEIKRNTTLFGPQKDEFRILINGGTAREFASQGQHKSILIALKFSEFRYLATQKNETPIILFDDIFSELDILRVEKVINLLADSSAQIFITLTEPNLIKFNNDIQKTFFEINAGKIL